MSSGATQLIVQNIRKEFEWLSETEWKFMENAGGSQMPKVVADAVRNYLGNSFVQLSAGYELSDYSTSLVNESRRFMENFFNSKGIGEVILGPSTSQLIFNLANAYESLIEPGDEIILSTAAHEANVGPWVQMASRSGAIIKWCDISINAHTGEVFTLNEDLLKELLNEKTKIVALPHVSNLLGEIIDVKRISEMVHAYNAVVVIDGVAYAPHRAIDVANWDVDWYVFSLYKVYAPHMAAMFGSNRELLRVKGQNWFFIDCDDVPYKWEIGGVNHEGCAGIVALKQYFKNILSHMNLEPAASDRKLICAVFEVFAELEQEPMEKIIYYINSCPKIRLIGIKSVEVNKRVPTISFVHSSLSCCEVVKKLHEAKIACRNGHMYAVRLSDALKFQREQGVVRLSLVHYNSLEEVKHLISSLEQLK